MTLIQLSRLQCGEWEEVGGVYELVNSKLCNHKPLNFRGSDKSLARPGRKQATETEDFEFHTCISYL